MGKWKIRSVFPAGFLERLRDPESRITIITYVGLVETIELSLLSFALLLTAEAVLPGIVSSRINLATPLLAISLLSVTAIRLGKTLNVSLPFSPDRKHILTWVGIAWLAFLITISSVGFPPVMVPIIVGALFLVIRLFWQLMFRGE